MLLERGYMLSPEQVRDLALRAYENEEIAEEFWFAAAERQVREDG